MKDSEESALSGFWQFKDAMWNTTQRNQCANQSDEEPFVVFVKRNIKEYTPPPYFPA